MSQTSGKIAQVIGPVIDVSFEGGAQLPNILDALVVVKPNGQKVILETQKHIVIGLSFLGRVEQSNR